VWVKRGDYVLLEPIIEGGKVKAEIVRILYKDQIKYIKSEGLWPKQFADTPKSEDLKDSVKEGKDKKNVDNSDDDSDNDDDLFKNTNRREVIVSESEEETSEEEDEEEGEEEEEEEVNDQEEDEKVINDNVHFQNCHS